MFSNIFQKSFLFDSLIMNNSLIPFSSPETFPESLTSRMAPIKHQGITYLVSLNNHYLLDSVQLYPSFLFLTSYIADWHSSQPLTKCINSIFLIDKRFNLSSLLPISFPRAVSHSICCSLSSHSPFRRERGVSFSETT